MRLPWKILAGVLGCIVALSTFGPMAPVAHAANLGDVTITANTALGQSGPDAFAGVYEYNNLTLAAGVHVTSKGISQLVLIVHGTLTINEGADIRVRNGFYPDAPKLQISSVTPENYRALGQSRGAYNVYPGAYGKGGDGGKASNGANGLSAGSTLRGAGGGGGGGGGGYGGGKGGSGGRGGTGAYYNNKKMMDGGNGGDGYANGGPGGSSGSGGNAYGGESTGLGRNGSEGEYSGGGGGGGGNGGNGGRTVSTAYMMLGGGGGGGGGYGGGILTIIADQICINSSKPVFLVSGQKGGAGGSLTAYTAYPGARGEGGMLVIQTNNYAANPVNWKSISTLSDTPPNYEGGHGLVIGDPQLALINGVSVVTGTEVIPTTGITAPVSGIALSATELNLEIGGRVALTANVLPDNADDKAVIWSNSNPAVAMFTPEGVVIGLAEGDTNLVAVTRTGSFSAVCRVHVSSTAATPTPDAQPTPTPAEQPTPTPEPQPTPVPPGTPDVKAAAASYNSISLSWPAVAGAKNYVVYQSRAQGSGFKKLSTATKPRFVAKNLITGVPYYYKVVAMGVNKKKPVAMGTSATVTATTSLSQPGGLKGKAQAPGKVKLTWKKVTGASGYVVLKQGADGSLTAVGTPSSATMTVTKLPAGQSTTFVVRAYRKAGSFRAYSPDSAPVTINH